MNSINETIEKHGNMYKVYSKKKVNGKRKLLGTHRTRAKAVDQLQAIEASKSEAANEAKKEMNKFSDFANAREAGAEKIVNTAKSKGGFAMLTWHHFKVKLPYYKRAAAGKFDLDDAKKEFKKTYEKISTSMSQIDFQTEMGRLEVLGELIIKEESLPKKMNESQVLSYSQFINKKKNN